MKRDTVVVVGILIHNICTQIVIDDKVVLFIIVKVDDLYIYIYISELFMQSPIDYK